MPLTETRQLLIFAMLSLLATPLSLPIAFALLRLYRRRIEKLTGQVRERRAPGTPMAPTPPVAVGDGVPDDPPGLEILARRATVRHARWYVAAAAVFAVSATAVFLSWLGVSTDTEPLGLVRIAVLCVVMFGLPLVLTARIVWIATPWTYGLLVVSYVALLALVALAARFAVGALLWLVLPPLVLLLTSASRAVRGVSWLLAPVVTTVFVAVVPLLLLQLFPAADTVSVLAIAGAATIVCGVFAGLVWWLYLGRKIGDHTVALLVFWYYESLWLAVLGVLDDDAGWWALLAFLPLGLFALVLTSGYRALRRETAQRPELHLLLLRPFARSRRNVRLLRDLGLHWRHLGAVVLIGGADLAAETLEPDELVDWWRGRLARRVIASAADVPGRLEELRLGAGADAQYRVHDVICAGEAWQRAVEELATPAGSLPQTSPAVRHG